MKSRIARLSLNLALPLLLLSAGCLHRSTNLRSLPDVAPVTVAEATSKDVPIQVQAIGHVTPFASVSVKSLVDGQLERALFNEGETVKQGQTILTIDSRTFETALHQAEANLARDTALATNAMLEARRETTLFDDNVVAADISDQARAAADAARATVLADQSAVENARLQLAYCTIATPINGRAGKLLVNAGNLVKNNDTVLVVLNQTRPIYVDFSVPEQELPPIREHMANGRLKVEATVPGHETNSSAGELRLIDNTVDTATGTVPLRASFPNEEEVLWPGQFVNVTLTLATRTNAVVVPSQAVQVGQQGQYLFVVKPDLTVEMRPIVAGNRIGEETIIESGVHAGEKLVSSGQPGLAPGMRVQIHNEGSHSVASTP